MKTSILLIDDDAGIRGIYEKLLRYEGFEVYSVPNAKLAAETLFLTDPALVLLDINLPDFGGEMMFDVMRSHNPKLKIIVSSVYPVIRQRQWIRGASAYFDKAQGTQALLEIIHETLGKENISEKAV